MFKKVNRTDNFFKAELELVPKLCIQLFSLYVAISEDGCGVIELKSAFLDVKNTSGEQYVTIMLTRFSS